MKMVPAVLAAGVAIVIGLSQIGADVSTQEPQPSVSPPLDDARAAIRSKLKLAAIKEVHLISPGGTVCGLINHKGSKVGWAPFAYNHELGLAVAEVWGLKQPENLNKLYGCHFLPLAYTDEWKTPFWGGEGGDEYISAPQSL
jgi:hypothetical protein